MNSLFPRTPTEIAPGAVHIPDWLDLQQQQALVAACRDWAAGPAAMRHTRLTNGSTMSVQTVCLGWHWTPYRYTRTAIDQNNAPVAPFPSWLADLGRAALRDVHGVVRKIQPGTADPATGLDKGRLNLTMRVTGLS